MEMKLEAFAVSIGRNALYGSILVDPNALPEHINAFVYDYGMRQILNDAVSDKTDKDGNALTATEVQAKAQAKYDQLVTGELRKRREGGMMADDPAMYEAVKEAKKIIEGALRTQKCWPKNGDDKFQRAVNARMKSLKRAPMDAVEYVAKWLDANPHVLEEAFKTVERRRKQTNLKDAGL